MDWILFLVGVDLDLQYLGKLLCQSVLITLHKVRYERLHILLFDCKCVYLILLTILEGGIKNDQKGMLCYDLATCINVYSHE